jgi:hypothetical protein
MIFCMVSHIESHQMLFLATCGCRLLINYWSFLESICFVKSIRAPLPGKNTSLISLDINRLLFKLFTRSSGCGSWFIRTSNESLEIELLCLFYSTCRFSTLITFENLKFLEFLSDLMKICSGIISLSPFTSCMLRPLLLLFNFDSVFVFLSSFTLSWSIFYFSIINRSLPRIFICFIRSCFIVLGSR